MMTTLLLSTLKQPPSSRDANFDQVREASLRCLQCVQTASECLDSFLTRDGFYQWLGVGLSAWELAIRPAGCSLSERPRAWERFAGPSWHHIPVSAVSHLNDVVARAAIELSEAGEPSAWPAIKELVRKPIEELARLPWDELRQKIDEEYQAAKRPQKAPFVDDENQAGTKAGEASPMPQYVTLDQAAAMVNRAKKTLERHLNRRKGKPTPPPDIEGGGGKPHEWLWSRIRPWLEEEFGRKLPSDYPSLR